MSTEAPSGVQPLIDSYVAHLTTKRGRSRSKGHIAEVNRRVRRMLDGVENLADVTPLSIEERMRELLDEIVRIRGEWRPRTTQTIDGHRRELGTFFRWAVKRGHAKRNPVRKVERYDPEDSRWSSRPFTAEEALQFFGAVADADRYVVYLFWATTGLRPDETRRCRMSQLVLAPLDTRKAPHLLITRATAKNHKAVEQPIHPVLAELLRARPARDPDAAIFEHVPTNRDFLEDLKRAGLYEDRARAEGTLTPTSLRKLFATDLDLIGASEGQAQKLMRHSRPELTRNIYTHHALNEKAKLVARLSFVKPRKPA